MSSRPSSRASSVTPSHTQSTPSARRLRRSTLSTHLSDKAARFMASVVKQPHTGFMTYQRPMVLVTRREMSRHRAMGLLGVLMTTTAFGHALWCFAVS